MALSDTPSIAATRLKERSHSSKPSASRPHSMASAEVAPSTAAATKAKIRDPLASLDRPPRIADMFPCCSRQPNKAARPGKPARRGVDESICQKFKDIYFRKTKLVSLAQGVSTERNVGEASEEQNRKELRKA